MKSIANPIRLVAVLCVAATSAFIMFMSYQLLNTLSGPGWCATALGAGKATSADGTVKGLDACVGLLTIQLKSLATNSFIFGGVIAMCLLVLIVIVIAGAKLELKAGPDGIDMKTSRDAPAAAQTVADSAQQTADVIKDAAP